MHLESEMADVDAGTAACRTGQNIRLYPFAPLRENVIHETGST